MFQFTINKAAACVALASILQAATPAVPAKSLDVEVRDQNGHAVRFYRDLVQNRVVAINFIFTRCQTICPLLGATFAKVDRLLAGRHVSNVLLISVSIDPVNDSPAQLQSYAARYGATQQWKLVTGDKGNIEQILRALGEYTADKNAHTGRVLIGRGDGDWIRVDGLASPEKIADLLAAAAQRAAGSGR